MGGLGKDRYQFTGLTNGARYRYLQMRAQRLEWTLSKAATRLLDAWFDAGCPPLSKFDVKPPPFREDEWQTVETKGAKPSSPAATDTILDDEDEKAGGAAPNAPDDEPPAKRRGNRP